MEKQVELTLSQFKKAVETGAFTKVVVQSMWTHFSVHGELRGGGRGILVTSRRRVELRRFLNPAAALALLRQMGVNRAEVEMEGWDLELSSLTMRMRPDVTARRVRERRLAETAFDRFRQPESEELSREHERDTLLLRKMRIEKVLRG